MNIAYQDDLITLYRGDCLKIMPQLPDKSVDMIFCDPPYGHANHEEDLNSHLNEHRGIDDQPILNDKKEDMRPLISNMLKQAVHVLKQSSGIACCCSGGGGEDPTFAWLASRMDTDDLSFVHSVIWDKINPGLGWRFRRQHEMIMVARLTNGKFRWNKDDVAVPNIMRFSPPRDRLHPNEKPLRLVSHFINLCSQPNDTVLDPFCGSGTTLIAAAELGRKAIGIELDNHWCDVAVDRLKEWAKQPRLNIINEPLTPLLLPLIQLELDLT